MDRGYTLNASLLIFNTLEIPRWGNPSKVYAGGLSTQVFSGAGASILVLCPTSNAQAA